MKAFAVAAALLVAALFVSCSKQPTAPPVTSVSTSPVTLTLRNVGASQTITATVRGDAGELPNTPVSWSSSNPGVAIVGGTSATGTVTAVGAGTALITATAGGRSGASQVTVDLMRTLSLSLIGNGTGTVTSLPPGVLCSIVAGVQAGSCSADFIVGTTIQLLATVDTGSVLLHWSAPCSGTGACSVTLDQPRTIEARIESPCTRITPYVVGSTVADSVIVQSCLVAGRRTVMYQYTFAAHTTFTLRANAPTFPTLMSPIVSAGDFWVTTAPGVGMDAVAHVIAAPGTYLIHVGSTSGILGNYSLSSLLDPVLQCEDLDVTPGISFSANLSEACELSMFPNVAGERRIRLAFLVIPAGGTLSARMTSAAFDPVLLLLNTDFVVLRSSGADPPSPTASLVYTSPTTQAVLVILSSLQPQMTGAYTFTIDPLTAVASAALGVPRASLGIDKARLKAAVARRRR